MSNCVRCETLDTTTYPEFLVKVVGFRHPTLGWMDVENGASKLCGLCVKYVQAMPDIKVIVRGVLK
jgi:hypothetical protein